MSLESSQLHRSLAQLFRACYTVGTCYGENTGTFIDDGKWKEAKEFLDEYLKSELRKEERGAAYVRFASLYMQMMTRLNQEEIKVLDDAIRTLRDLNNNEEETKKDITLSFLKKDITK